VAGRGSVVLRIKPRAGAEAAGAQPLNYIYIPRFNFCLFILLTVFDKEW
jgi:hypothetical protein